MSDTPIGDATAAERLPEAPEGQHGVLAVQDRLTTSELELLLSPHTVSPVNWIRSLMTNDEWPESDPEEMALGMMAQILMAESSDEALKALDLERAKDLCGGAPGGRSPALEIYGARALKSEYEEGAACYTIISAVNLQTGEKIRFTTGARAVQMVVAKHLYEGWIPFRAALEIRREKTRNGFYPLNLVGGI